MAENETYYGVTPFRQAGLCESEFEWASGSSIVFGKGYQTLNELHTSAALKRKSTIFALRQRTDFNSVHRSVEGVTKEISQSRGVEVPRKAETLEHLEGHVYSVDSKPRGQKPMELKHCSCHFEEVTTKFSLNFLSEAH
ncbi:hypothetical protein ACJ72_02986 [Emergomyces africanus]|uniref:Uncharacterized protein n=1 Tax=Emergomyces africanus TaxID=1955775 RepID=A0A1B7P0W8_9EURO|nr:hypothetical protein ACJ72_02986 [Emergomyces africanus]